MQTAPTTTPSPMSFERFQATRAWRANLADALPYEPICQPAEGNLYCGALFILKVTPDYPERTRARGGWHLIIGNCEWVSDDLAQLERQLYDFAVSEGLAEDTGAAEPAVRVWTVDGTGVLTATRSTIAELTSDEDCSAFFGFFRCSRQGDALEYESENEAIRTMQVGDRLYCGGGAAPLFVVERVS